MRGTINRLVQAALIALETGQAPPLPADLPEPGIDAETLLRACILGLEARGCMVEISARPSWDGDAWPYCGFYDRDGSRIWVYGGLETDEKCEVLLHEAAHHLDRGRTHREFVAAVAMAAAVLGPGVCTEPEAVRRLTAELGAAARATYGRDITPEETVRRVRRALGDRTIARAARAAGELVALILEGREEHGSQGESSVGSAAPGSSKRAGSR